MRPKSLMLLVLALGCGLVASIGISQVMDRNAKRPAAVQTAPIYVALHNINLGDPIDATMVSLQEWPKDKIPPGAIAKLEDIEGRRPRAAIIQGEPILDGKLLAPGQLADPITAIPKGYRLKTISVDATTLEANAAMRSIVRRDTGESYQEFLTRLVKASGIRTPSRAALARPR